MKLKISRNWLPRYFRRLYIAEKIICGFLSVSDRIADIGSGEGILVQRLLDNGFQNVIGVDPYAPIVNPKIVRGSIIDLPLSAESLDALTCLDVLEHLPLHLQHQASGELSRVLKRGGIAIISVPNMAHLMSRISFLLKGKPWRNKLNKHPGELSIHERIRVLQDSGLICIEKIGLHLTLMYDPCPNGLISNILTRLMFSPWVPAGLCWTVVLLLYKQPIPESIKSCGKKNLMRNILAEYEPPIEDPTFKKFR